MLEVTGAIYGIYHLTSRRWYVGQTIGTIHKRAQGHWWSRFRESDAFHDALAVDPNPFSFIPFPLEWIPAEDYIRPGLQRRLQVKEFRKVATPRERFWVEKLNSMWPHGWNSAVPGVPVAAYALRQHQRDPMAASQQKEEAKAFAEEWSTRWKAQPEDAISAISRQPKSTIRDTIHHLQAHHSPADLNVNGQSPVPLLIEELRRRRKEAPKRHFLRFRFTCNSARDLLLRSVLRDPVIYNKHPEPDVGAAIMVSDNFSPQIQALLFNYTEAALQLDLHEALTDPLLHCPCRSSFRLINPEDLGPSGMSAPSTQPTSSGATCLPSPAEARSCASQRAQTQWKRSS